MNCLILILEAALLINASGINCPTTICSVGNFSQYQNVCIQNQAAVKYYYMIINDLFGTSSADNGYYCDPTILHNLSQQYLLKKPNRMGCAVDIECNSGHCIKNYCSNQLGEGRDCNISSNCKSGLGCNSTGICSELLKIGMPCTTQPHMCNPVFSSCYNNVCTQFFSLKDGTSLVADNKLCISTYTFNQVCVNRTNLPQLQYEDKKLYKSCSFDSDCIYSPSNSIYVPASKCNCVPDSNVSTGYCAFGGGEKELLVATAEITKRYKNSTNIGAMYYPMNIDLVMRNRFNNPGNCTLSAFLLQNSGSLMSSIACIAIVLIVSIAI